MFGIIVAVVSVAILVFAFVIYFCWVAIIVFSWVVVIVSGVMLIPAVIVAINSVTHPVFIVVIVIAAIVVDSPRFLQQLVLCWFRCLFL